MSYDSWKLASPPWYDLPEQETTCKECSEPCESEIEETHELCLPCLVIAKESTTNPKTAARYVSIHGGQLTDSEDYDNPYIKDLVDKHGEFVRYVVE